MADDSKNGSEKDRNAPTVRDLTPRALPKDTVPDVVGQYVPPRPLPEASQHRTLDLTSVRVSKEPDPRRAPTERRLVSPAREEPKSSGRWLAAGLVVLLGTAVWLLVRALASSSEPAPAPGASLASPARTAGAPPAPVPASSAPTQAAPSPVASSPSEPAEPRDLPPVRTETPASASAAPKAPAAREPEKKRREPWLE